MPESPNDPGDQDRWPPPVDDRRRAAMARLLDAFDGDHAAAVRALAAERDQVVLAYDRDVFAGTPTGWDLEITDDNWPAVAAAFENHGDDGDVVTRFLDGIGENYALYGKPTAD